MSGVVNLAIYIGGGECRGGECRTIFEDGFVSMSSIKHCKNWKNCPDCSLNCIKC